MPNLFLFLLWEEMAENTGIWWPRNYRSGRMRCEMLRCKSTELQSGISYSWSIPDKHAIEPLLGCTIQSLSLLRYVLVSLHSLRRQIVRFLFRKASVTKIPPHGCSFPPFFPLSYIIPTILHCSLRRKFHPSDSKSFKFE